MTFLTELVLSKFRSTSFQNLVPAPFEVFFCVFNVVVNESFSVVTRKLTGFYLVTSEKHLEGTFNLYIYVYYDIVLVC